MKKSFKILERVGLSEAEKRNAKQLTEIYLDYVEGGYATIDWWERLNSVQARLINSASFKHGSWTLRKEHLLNGTLSDWLRIKKLAEEA